MTDSKSKKHVILCGTGRAGTSFLMRLLTNLDIDTGYTKEKDGFDKSIRAGCEKTNGNPSKEIGPWNNLPHVVKSPLFSAQLNNIPADIQHVIIPIRDLDAVLESRKKTNLVIEGGIKTLQAWIGAAVAYCVLNEVPFTLIRFPELTYNTEYLFECLSNAFDLDREKFNQVFERLTKEHQELKERANDRKSKVSVK